MGILFLPICRSFLPRYAAKVLKIIITKVVIFMPPAAEPVLPPINIKDIVRAVVESESSSYCKSKTAVQGDTDKNSDDKSFCPAFRPEKRCFAQTGKTAKRERE